MPRIRLLIQRHSHDLARQVGQTLDAVRVYADVVLPDPAGNREFQRAIIDTGAPVSMFPRYFWNGVPHKALGEVRVGGIARRDECRIPATLAEVECMLSDGSTSLGPLRIHAYLADSDSVPALLGMAGLLERVRLVVDVPAGEAYCEDR